MISIVTKILNGASRRCTQSVRTLASGQPAVNEPIVSYDKGTQLRADLEAALKDYDSKVHDIPIVIGDEEIRTNDVHQQVRPFDHTRPLAKFHYADKTLLQKAIDVSLQAFTEWQARPIEDRMSVFMKAADLVAGKYRMDLMASTMHGQGKTIIQAEIDVIAELADFFRFNAAFGMQLGNYQPISTETEHNSMRLRPVEGFWAAITPFNFTAIGGNLPSAPAMMGNVVLWKPSDTAMLSNYIVYKLMREAGLPPGVINFVPADGPLFGDVITQSPHLAGINFTGSVRTFQLLWKLVGQNIEKYRTYPRLIGECGGKNYHFVHNTADIESVVNGTIRSCFEYSGQKCSACSRMYVPKSKWLQIKEGLVNNLKNVQLGSPLEASSFLSAVIDEKAFDRIKGYLDHIKSSPNLTLVAGGHCDKSKGYYVEPTICETTDPHDKIMQEEIFGPVLSVYAYEDAEYLKIIDLIESTSPFGLTGAVFAKDQSVIDHCLERLKQTAGNFYINDKSTGSVVGQQPFGGARASGTNDKAGGPNYLLKFSSPQSIKQTVVPLTKWSYPYMEN